MKKRALILALAGIMAASLTGCGSLKDDAVVVKAGDEEITAGVANFYARYTQAQYETYFASYFGGDDMWTKNASDGKTYEESIKETLLDDLKNMALLEKHMKDYDVKLTKADKKAINDAAEEFDKANSQKKKDKVSGSEENVKRVMTLMVIEQKMRSAIVAEANVNVTDEEAVQKHMQYVEFDYTTSSDSSDSSDTTVSDDEKKQVKEKAAAFAEGAKTAEDFASYATEQGTEAKDATFDSDSVSPSKEVVKAADKLGEGELTGVVESDTACYVAKVTSLNDEAATETKKQSLLTEKQDKYYKKVAQEAHMFTGFVRFKEIAPLSFYAQIEPVYNILPIILNHFTLRFSDQNFIIHDLKREKAIMYNKESSIITDLSKDEGYLLSNLNNDENFESLWKTFYKSVNIKERENSKLRNQHMPKRYWNHLTEI